LLAGDLELGATNAMNGDKILPLGGEYDTDAAALTIGYGMGQGLRSFAAKLS
jgi:hypothetical protein